MSDFTIAILGVVAVVFAAMCVAFATARRRQDRLALAFERAQAVRTRGSTGLQGGPHGIYGEAVWNVRQDRGSG